MCFHAWSNFHNSRTLITFSIKSFVIFLIVKSLQKYYKGCYYRCYRHYKLNFPSCNIMYLGIVFLMLKLCNFISHINKSKNKPHSHPRKTETHVLSPSQQILTHVSLSNETQATNSIFSDQQSISSVFLPLFVDSPCL